MLVQGGGPSGIDIVLELCETSPMVYFSHRYGTFGSKLPDNVIELPDVSRVNSNGDFVFENNEVVNIDVFIPCTGYAYTFPFLNSESEITVNNNRRVVKGLYKHLFNIKYPSLAIVGIPWKNAPFPLFHQQSNYITSIFSEVKQLPDAVNMSLDTEKEWLERLSQGDPARYFHQSGLRQFPYNDQLAELSGCKKNPPIIENLYRYAQVQRRVDVVNYKKEQYLQLNESDFQHVTIKASKQTI